MRLKIKTLKNFEIDIEIDSDATFADIKEKIKETVSTPINGSQVLIHQGKIMSDDVKISDYGKLNNDDKLVLLLHKEVKRTHINNTNMSSEQKNHTVPKANDSTRDKNELNIVSSNNESGKESEVDAIENQTNNTSTFNQDLETLISLGFNRSKATQALMISSNNLDTAIELLLSESGQYQQDSSHLYADANTLTDNFSQINMDGCSDEDLSTIPFDMSDLRALVKHPLFQDVKDDIKINPDLFSAFLQMIIVKNPELAAFILNNIVEFVRLLTEDSDDDDDNGNGNGNDIAGNDQTDEDNNAILPGTNITPSQLESITRLQNLGFSQRSVLEALGASQWDEENAANLLLDHIGEFESNDE